MPKYLPGYLQTKGCNLEYRIPIKPPYLDLTIEELVVTLRETNIVGARLLAVFELLIEQPELYELITTGSQALFDMVIDEKAKLDHEASNRLRDIYRLEDKLDFPDGE